MSVFDKLNRFEREFKQRQDAQQREDAARSRDLQQFISCIHPVYRAIDQLIAANVRVRWNSQTSPDSRRLPEPNYSSSMYSYVYTDSGPGFRRNVIHNVFIKAFRDSNGRTVFSYTNSRERSVLYEDDDRIIDSENFDTADALLDKFLQRLAEHRVR